LFIRPIGLGSTETTMPIWSELSNETFSQIAGKTEVVVMVTGSLEAHGKHLPLGTDSILPTYLAQKLVERTNAVVLPTIPFGDSWSFNEFKGTISIHPTALVDFYTSVMKGVFKHGFKYIMVLNGHGGNVGPIQIAAKTATKKGERVVVIVNWWRDLATNVREEVLETPMGHAAEDETSEVLHVRPDLVEMSAAEAHRIETEFTIISGTYREDLLPSAMYGDPRKASEEKGRRIMEQAEEELVQLVKKMERGELPIKHP
jgi:creatinine amidohydrolase